MAGEKRDRRIELIVGRPNPMAGPTVRIALEGYSELEVTGLAPHLVEAAEQLAGALGIEPKLPLTTDPSKGKIGTEEGR